MTDKRCATCLYEPLRTDEVPCRTCGTNDVAFDRWQPKDDTYTHPVVGKVHVHPTPGVASDFETHPPGTMRRIAQLEQEVAACERRLADMAREMQKFMDEARRPGETPREQDLLARIRAQCDHAAMNDHRLPALLGQREGPIAVREGNIDAAIEGWRREHGLLPPG